MKPVSCTYSLRLTLGQYQHEELSCTLEAEPSEKVSASDLLAEARKTCWANTTAARKIAKKGGEDEAGA